MATLGQFYFTFGARILRKGDEEPPLTSGEFAMPKALVRQIPPADVAREVAQLARGRGFEFLTAALMCRYHRLRKPD
ncbi:MAG: hypothetical protein IPP21_08905 [Betaproteobacteria bacterium]|nr:hypothetical protein [Betaproteobacteria bacterium]